MYTSASVIHQIYLRVNLTPIEQHTGGITVNGFTGHAHTFHRERLRDEYTVILSAIKLLPRIMLHSQSPNGVPWVIARSHTGQYDGSTLETAEQLLVMGIALGFVRVVKNGDTITDIPYVVIDDDRLIRNEKLKPAPDRKRMITRWHK